MLHASRVWLPIAASLLLGVVMTIAVAIGCAYLSSAPIARHQFMNEFTGRGTPEYRALDRETPDTERVVVMMCSGLGYRSQDIQYFETEAVKLTDYPPAIRRSFKTELGWPNVALETNSRSIGARFELGLSPSSLARGEQALHDGKPTTWRIRWSGFVFNSLLAATLMLGLYAMVAAPLGWWRSILISICLGLWLTLITAWACDLILQYASSHIWPRSYREFADPATFGQSVATIDIPPAEKWDQFVGFHSSSIGLDTWWCSFSKFIPNAYKGRDGVASVSGDSSFSLGWPLYSLKGRGLPHWVIGGASAQETRTRHLIALFATPVHWPGLIVNWPFWTLVILLLWKGPGRIRAWQRARTGKCTRCGYPIGQSEQCTECGRTLPRPVSN